MEVNILAFIATALFILVSTAFLLTDSIRALGIGISLAADREILVIFSI